jgi:hypothetical protein
MACWRSESRLLAVLRDPRTPVRAREQGARSSGVNFAIGVDVVRECVPRLIVYGSSAGVRAPQGEPPRAA